MKIVYFFSSLILFLMLISQAFAGSIQHPKPIEVEIPNSGDSRYHELTMAYITNFRAHKALYLDHQRLEQTLADLMLQIEARNAMIGQAEEAAHGSGGAALGPGIVGPSPISKGEPIVGAAGAGFSLWSQKKIAPSEHKLPQGYRELSAKEAAALGQNASLCLTAEGKSYRCTKN